MGWVAREAMRGRVEDVVRVESQSRRRRSGEGVQRGMVGDGRCGGWCEVLWRVLGLDLFGLVVLFSDGRLDGCAVECSNG